MGRSGGLTEIRTEHQAVSLERFDPLGKLVRLLLPEDRRAARDRDIFEVGAGRDQLPLNVQLEAAERPVGMCDEELGDAVGGSRVEQSANLSEAEVAGRQARIGVR